MSYNNTILQNSMKYLENLRKITQELPCKDIWRLRKSFTLRKGETACWKRMSFKASIGTWKNNKKKVISDYCKNSTKRQSKSMNWQISLLNLMVSYFLSREINRYQVWILRHKASSSRILEKTCATRARTGTIDRWLILWFQSRQSKLKCRNEKEIKESQSLRWSHLNWRIWENLLVTCPKTV